MSKDYEFYIAELNGYLNAIRRLRGNGFFFGVRSYKAVDKIDNFVNEMIREWDQHGSFKYHGKSKIEFRELKDKIIDLIFGGVLNTRNMVNEQAENYAKEMLIEDINEYYGLASVSINKDGVFHPLIAGPVYNLDIQNKAYCASFYYLVKIEDNYIVTYFRKKKSLALSRQIY
jgi:hypothetical protein